jgi:hypothetical protein
MDPMGGSATFPNPVMIRSVGIFSVAKMMGALYAMLGLIVGGLFALVSLAGVQVEGGGPMVAFGVFSLILFPLMYGILGFIGGLIMAFLYNIVASMVGGIELELGPRR